jgi:hypothetical protein
MQTIDFFSFPSSARAFVLGESVNYYSEIRVTLTQLQSYRDEKQPRYSRGNITA